MAFRPRFFYELRMDDVRKRLLARLEEMDLDFKALSLRINRNPAFIFQFIKQGKPKKLSEDDRRAIAAITGLTELELGKTWGKSNPNETHSTDLIDYSFRAIREVIASSVRGDISASGSPPCEVTASFVDSVAEEFWMLPEWFIKDGLKSEAEKVLAVRIIGDDNAPTLVTGDVVFLDTRHTEISPPGLYGMRDPYGKIIVHRLDAFILADRHVVRIRSDNPKQAERLAPIESIIVVGRVCGMMKAV